MVLLPTLRITGRKTLQESVYESLKLALMSGEFAPGQPLTVRAVTELAGTSPMPVRDAMRRLVAEGALEMLPNGLMRVRLMDRVQRDEAREIRQAIEGLALRRAARLAMPSEIDRVEEINEQFVVLEVANGVSVKMQKQAISAVLPKGTLKSA